jgi:hypothetical protein
MQPGLPFPGPHPAFNAAQDLRWRPRLRARPADRERRIHRREDLRTILAAGVSVLLLLVVFLAASFRSGNGQEHERLSGPLR